MRWAPWLCLVLGACASRALDFPDDLGGIASSDGGDLARRVHVCPTGPTHTLASDVIDIDYGTIALDGDDVYF